ncbi:MAG TPA: septum formation family protein [Ilumatobacteraceae bacterium]|nr:septum formation family protein [Ilumatobacteraceae bacterium]
MTRRCPSCEGSGLFFGQSRCTACNGEGTIGGPNLIQQHGLVAGLGGYLVLFVWASIAVSVLAIVGLIIGPRLLGKASDGITEVATGQSYPEHYVVGTCFVDEGFTPVDCASPHFSELYAISFVATDDATFPGTDRLNSFAKDACRPHFEPYSGTKSDDPTVRLGVGTPTEQDWAGGVRQILCVAAAPTGQSLKGSIRATG